MIVNPASGALVRDPATLAVIQDGADVDETNPYFARAIADGDLVSPPPADPAPAPTTKRSAPTPVEEGAN